MINIKPVTLQPMQVEMMALFNQSPYKERSTFEFRRAGIASPAQCVSQLKAKGAIIERTLKLGMDESGKWHSRVAFYLFKGWK